MLPRRYHIVLNAHSGAAQALGLTHATVRQRFESAGHDVIIDPDDASFTERIERVIASDADVIVAAGGDGTATALATIALEHGKTLAILPLGTANLLARDLALPLDFDLAVSALGAMQPRSIDVGEVNGRIFLHKVVIGFVPGVAAKREQLRGRKDLRAKVGFMRYLFRRIAQSRRIAVEISPADGVARVERIKALAVANNAYDEGFGRIFSRKRLDAGKLSLYIMRQLSVAELFRLTAKLVVGRWRGDPAIEIESYDAVTIRTKQPMVVAMIDGEIEMLSTPLVFKIRPLALSVLAPVSAEHSPEAGDQPEFVAGA